MKTDAPILARLAPSLLPEGANAPEEIMVFPAGQHTIHATQNDRPVTKTVLVDAFTAKAMQAALDAHVAAGPQKPYFDFNHDDDAASAWPLAFRWSDGADGRPAGVYAKLEWSRSGAEAVAGRAYRSFSPVFHVDGGNPARVTTAPLNMGGLVNTPAFRAQSPIWAKQPFPSQPNMSEQNNQPDPTAAAEALKAKEALASAQNELSALKAKDAARRKADAGALVAAAVARGALAPKDEAIQAKWSSLIEADPSHATLLAALPGRDITQPVTPAGEPISAKAGPVEVLKAYAAEKDAAKRGAIYAKDVIPLFQPGFALGPILAANSLGSVAGDLIVLRALDLLKLSFPALSGITTDFSAESARQGQAIKTRIVGVPSVVTLDDSTGWSSSDATTTDVTVTIGQPKGVQIEYTSTELANTLRDIFGEQVEACHYALGKNMFDALYAVITAANFANATTKALATFTRNDVTAMAKALTGRGVSAMGRTLLLNQDYYEKLGQDSTIVNLAAYSMPGVITQGDLPPVAKFAITEAVNLPGTGNLTGFGFTKDALVLATRVPEDYTRALPGASNGAVSVITNPITGMSVQKVDFVDHKLAKAYSRIAIAYGVAKGNGSSGQRLISA